MIRARRSLSVRFHRRCCFYRQGLSPSSQKKPIASLWFIDFSTVFGVSHFCSAHVRPYPHLKKRPSTHSGTGQAASQIRNQRMRSVEKGHHDDSISKKNTSLSFIPHRKTPNHRPKRLTLKGGVQHCRPTHPNHTYKRDPPRRWTHPPRPGHPPKHPPFRVNSS